MNNYNTVRPALILKEYGRNMQMLVDHIRTLEDKEKRTESAYVLIELMKLINPNARDSQESSQKLWDDLFIMSDFDLDIDSPYPMPEKEILSKKPEPLGYKTSEIRFKHYGRNIQLLIKKAIELQDPEDKDSAVIHIGRLMKSFQNTWNRDNVEDTTILKNIEKMSNKELTIDIERVKSENLFDSMVKERRSRPNNKNRRNNSGGRRRRN
ncbi:MAG: DUF4290 domain-containing protein [Cyclobacteriaceae bacterium]|nr:DUF4290 domain-containing protein [Cyclobacteriaceae bacterium]MCK5470421.1 DUF4290 domain-containing protein [Cyclobacteriaceae bacterium]